MLDQPLSPAQRRLLDEWLPGYRVVHDHGWGLVDSVVLEVVAGGGRYIVKADGATNHHVPREIDAHECWLLPWVQAGRAPRFVAGDREAKVVVTEYLPGDLVLGSPAQELPDTFRQAGLLLAQLHAQPGRVDDEHEAVEDAKVLRNLDARHRIAPGVASRVRDLVTSWPTEPVLLVPTHGDWQPRNWLVHDGVVSAIDFGRSAPRPAMTDWLRLHSRDFRYDPAREAAFVEGYGSDPRTGPAWFRERLARSRQHRGVGSSGG